MTGAQPDPWGELSQAIADGRSVDWDRWAGERALDPSKLEAMRALEALRRSNEHRPAVAGAPGGFELLEELGRGSYARVHRARDLALGREVALKVSLDDRPLSAQESDRFLEEARVLASVDHPNIVRVHSVDRREGKLVICLEHVVGRTLAQIVEQSGSMSCAEAAQIGIDLCRALAALHAKGVVHRDLKPSNVMRASGGRIVLLDFGFARSVQADATFAGGTPRYMAPELFDPAAAASPKVDLYALGVMLYWLVTGAHPHRASDLDELRREVLEGRSVPLTDRLPTAPPAFVALVERALARQDARFASAGEMERALRDFLAGADAQEAPTGVAAVARAATPQSDDSRYFVFPWKGMLIMSAIVGALPLAWLAWSAWGSPSAASEMAPQAADGEGPWTMQAIYLSFAIGGGALLLIQLVLALLGGGHDLDVGHDVGGDLHHGDLDASTIGISFRTVVAFITFFGITGMAARSGGISNTWSFVLAMVVGSLAFWLVGLAFLQLHRLRASGNVRIENAVGAIGRVYLTIPPNNDGEGAVTVPIQGRTAQFRAITRGAELKTGVACKVVAVHGADTVEVAAV